MISINLTSKSVFAKLIEPLGGLIDKSKLKRKCKTLNDQQWIETELLRILSQKISGRAFLQKLYDTGKIFLSRSLFFESVKSKKRLKLCQEINSSVCKGIAESESSKDSFALFSELHGFDIYAGDGHFHRAAAQDIIKAGKKYPTQHFYASDLCSHALTHLTLADTTGSRKREHDIHALKRLDNQTLRQSAPKGRKVLYVGNKAGIDFLQWFK